MAEQCIVCLDALLHAEEPPPPLPDGDPSGPPNSAPVETTGGPGTDTAEASHTANDGIARAIAAAASAAHNESHDDDHVAVIQICGHTLHDTCLREWTGKANSCPICRQSFHSVKVYDKIGGKLLSTYEVEDKKQVAEFDPQAWLDEFAEAEDEDVSTPCPVCNLADHEDVLLLCDGCDTPYHTHCIGLDSVPRGAWFCMECVDLLGDAIQQPYADSPVSTVRQPGRRTRAAARPRNDYFPRTRHTMRRARQRARSDEWQGAWGQITGRIWDALNIDLDHDEDEALEEFRRVERLRDNERREFERWQERLDIARRLGAQDVFEQNIPTAILRNAGRHTGGPSQASTASGNSRAQPVSAQQTREERRAWGAFERARECDQVITPATRKRKSRSVTASPVDPPQEPERKLKRPRTRRIGAPSEVASSSNSPALLPTRATVAGPAAGASASAAASRTASIGAVPAAANGAMSPPNAAANASSPVVARPPGNEEPRSFLSSLLKEVEMSAPSDDENIRSLFGESRPAPVDPSSPVASSPAASAYNSPRALSTTPPPNRMLRPSSPTLLSSHIEPIYPPANYSPNRAGTSIAENSDSEGHNPSKTAHASSSSNNTNNHHHHHNHNHHGNNNHSHGHNSNSTHHWSPPATELRQPRPRRMPIIPLPRSQDVSPTRQSLSLETKESISGIVRSALNPHWKSSQLTADQYAAINRDVSRKLYEEVTSPTSIDADARKLWEQKATREVAQAVADLQA